MPLYGVDKNGRFYEESSVTKKAKKKPVPFADQSSVIFGETSKKEVQAKKLAERQKRIKIQRIKSKEQRRKKILQEQKKKQFQAKQNKIKKQKQIVKKTTDKARKIYAQAKAQDTLGYEYSTLYGSPYDGFQYEGEIVDSLSSRNADINVVENFGNTMLGGHDEGLGFTIKKPKIKVSAPKIKVSAPKITAPKSFTAAVKDVGKIAAKAVTGPTQVGLSIVKATPLVKDVYKGVDKLTGGTLTSAERVLDLPNKIAAGKPVSKGELIEAAMLAAKIGAIAASGGSAASIVSATSGALKNGPLGQSALGKNILTITEIASTGMAVKDIIEQQAKSQAKTIAAKELEKKVGIPFSVIQAAYGVTSGQGSIAEKAKMFATKVGEDKLAQAGLGPSTRQAILSGNAEALGVMIKDTPNLAMSKAQREAEAQKVRLLKEASLEGLKSKIDKKVAQAQKDATDVQTLKDRADKEVNAQVKKQLENQLASLMKKIVKDQGEVQEMVAEHQLEAAQTSIKVAAAEEGRYTSSMESRNHHPLLDLHRKLVGKA